ncbi:MAG: hypothetical protein ACLFVU_11730 [Phycisphaerae bacterium]
MRKGKLMKKIDLSLVGVALTAGLLLVGCKPPEADTGYKKDTDEVQAGQDVDIARDGLQMALRLDRRTVEVGDTLGVKVLVHNGSQEPITINATSSALVKLFLWQDSAVGMSKKKTWPQAAAMVMSSWTLEPDEQREFIFELPVDRTWPTGELAWLSAELNGRDDLQPQLFVQVLPEKQSETE